MVALCATKAGDGIEIVEAGEGDVEGLARGRRHPIGREVDGQIFQGPRLALAGSSVVLWLQSVGEWRSKRLGRL